MHQAGWHRRRLINPVPALNYAGTGFFYDLTQFVKQIVGRSNVRTSQEREA